MMFYHADKFNGDISNWNTKSLINMKEMFFRAFVFNQNINNWDIQNVGGLTRVFYDNREFNQPIGKWNITNVQTLDSTFFGCEKFNQPLSSWDTSNVKQMVGTFRMAAAFNQDISGWDISNLNTMIMMFQGAKSFNQNLCKWSDKFPFKDVHYSYNMFQNSGCPYLQDPDPILKAPFCQSACGYENQIKADGPTGSPLPSFNIDGVGDSPFDKLEPDDEGAEERVAAKIALIGFILCLLVAVVYYILWGRSKQAMHTADETTEEVSNLNPSALPRTSIAFSDNRNQLGGDDFIDVGDEEMNDVALEEMSEVPLEALPELS